MSLFVIIIIFFFTFTASKNEHFTAVKEAILFTARRRYFVRFVRKTHFSKFPKRYIGFLIFFFFVSELPRLRGKRKYTATPLAVQQWTIPVVHSIIFFFFFHFFFYIVVLDRNKTGNIYFCLSRFSSFFFFFTHTCKIFEFLWKSVKSKSSRIHKQSMNHITRNDSTIFFNLFWPLYVWN